jgi:putative membrane protein
MASYFRAWQALPPRQLMLLLLLILALVLANIRQPYPDLAPLQHIPTVLLLVAAPLLLRRFPLSDAAVASLTGFFLLHTLAGRYTYSNVPYDDWARALTGHDISATFGLARNDFDRLVHLSFGLLWVAPFAEAVERHATLPRRAAIMMAFLFVGAFSAVYEIFEWQLTLLAPAGLADDYNGQQGDPWDSQKDMAMAILGATAASFWTLFRRRA